MNSPFSLGSHLRSITCRVYAADSQLSTFYGVACRTPDAVRSQLQSLDMTLAQLVADTQDMRDRIATLMEEKHGT
jgi:hypothetical protein